MCAGLPFFNKITKYIKEKIKKALKQPFKLHVALQQLVKNTARGFREICKIPKLFAKGERKLVT
jgi:hypothetical protein